MNCSGNIQVGDTVKIALPYDAGEWRNYVPSLQKYDGTKCEVLKVETDPRYGDQCLLLVDPNEGLDFWYRAEWLTLVNETPIPVDEHFEEDMFW